MEYDKKLNVTEVDGNLGDESMTFTVKFGGIPFKLSVMIDRDKTTFSGGFARLQGFWKGHVVEVMMEVTEDRRVCPGGTQLKVLSHATRTTPIASEE